MENTQNDKIITFDRVKDYHVINSVKINAVIDEYKPFEDRFMAGLKKAKAATLAQTTTPAENATTISLAKKQMATTIYKFASRGYELANAGKETTLAKSLHHPKGYVGSASKNTAVDRATALALIMENNSTILTNIVAADVLNMRATIAAFVKVKDLPVEKIQEKKVDGTDVLPGYIFETAQAMNSMYNLVVSYFEDAVIEEDRKLVNAFALAKQYISTGTHATGVLGTALLSNGQPCRNASIHIEGTDKDTVTDYQGNYSIAHIVAGFYTITCKTEGGDEVVKTIYIHNGVMEELNFNIA